MSDSARAVIDAIAAQWAVPGTAVVAVDRNDVVFAHYSGQSDVSARTPVGARHLFPIGSISKTFTAVALLQLLDGGRIRLDTTIADLLDWLPEPLRSNEITLQRLLNHTAGVIGSVDALPDEIGQATLYTGALSTAAPGSFFHYSNVGYILLGLAAATVSGRSLASLVEERILDPLRMRDTVARVTYDDYEALACGYQPRRDDRPWVPGDALAPAPWLEVAGADGNLAATAIDLGRFARMLLGGGQLDGTKILSTNAFEAMVSRLAPSGEDVLDLHGVAATESSRYGLGINVERCAGHTVLTHGGGMVGYASFLIADLDAGLAVCVLTNANGDTPVAEAIARCTAAELVGPGQVDINRLDPRWWDAAHVEKAGFLGQFRSSGGEVIHVSAAERRGELARLSVSGGGDTAPLLRTWGQRAVTTLPKLRRFALTFEGDRWHWGATELASDTTPVLVSAPDNPLTAFCGHYRCYSPWFTNFRVVLRGDRLLLIAPGGVEAPGDETELVPIGPAMFRIGADERLPERLTFGPPINGASPWADRGGCRYSRAFTE
ncbi:serine hydrolase domain-containing protein [Mycolicibacterium sarraceniae]|uniref:Beta-lactamase-related domain-containing protein n=1 Tax=Mycolicibacterium sarraceniae TaxID=1534348 RepID=A0A7I7SPL8_9MYCO|nr:serine hydrolase domain-containing protein [Mycolicibacterium sarraceniae]BBY58321.1 hypothetical protein MSAR_14570 [Mycolicibacterium sarraceniae]